VHTPFRLKNPVEYIPIPIWLIPIPIWLRPIPDPNPIIFFGCTSPVLDTDRSSPGKAMRIWFWLHLTEDWELDPLP
jgi:hypothetical protein